MLTRSGVWSSFRKETENAFVDFHVCDKKKKNCFGGVHVLYNDLA